MAVMQLFQYLDELMAHTTSGFYVGKLYQDKGKKTIYTPGWHLILHLVPTGEFAAARLGCPYTF